jgi:hypothetical protein
MFISVALDSLFFVSCNVHIISDYLTDYFVHVCCVVHRWALLMLLSSLLHYSNAENGLISIWGRLKRNATKSAYCFSCHHVGPMSACYNSKTDTGIYMNVDIWKLCQDLWKQSNLS